MAFFKKLCGLFRCKKQEEHRQIAERELVARYREVEQSAELKEFLELEKIVGSKEFIQKKYHWTNTDYKDTPTYTTISRYKELLHNKELQSFLEIESSTRLKNFLEFKASKDYAKLQDEKAVEKSPELQKMYDFEHSDEYKFYVQYCDDELPKEYKALEAQVATEEFKKDFAFWSNPNRWKTTDEYQQEARYKQLAERADIIFFQQQDPAEIARMEKELGGK